MVQRVIVMSTRMKHKKEEKRKIILDAAEELIAGKGIHTMTMDMVAGEADVAKGTLYLYFKNKDSLAAAVNANINKELNKHMKEKIGLCKSGTEKIIAIETAVIEYSRKNPQKWKAGIELSQMKLKGPEDPNVQSLLDEIDNMVQMLADAYRQGIEEGSIRKDVDPVSTAIYNRMAITNAFSPTSEQLMLLKRNNISPEHYLDMTWSLINRSTHTGPLVRADIERKMEDDNIFLEVGKELKGIIDSVGLKAQDAIETFDAWVHVNQMMMGKAEYEIKEATKDRVVFHITNCYVMDYSADLDIPIEMNVENCQKYCKTMVETINPKYTQRFTKMICTGDHYCEGVIELKK